MAGIRSLAAVLALMAVSCSSSSDLQYSAEVLGGAELDGPGDQIYLDLKNVDGLTDGGWVLQLPDDWPSRPRIKGERGGLQLDPLLDVSLVEFDLAVPSVKLEASRWSPWRTARAVGDSVDKRVAQQVAPHAEPSGGAFTLWDDRRETWPPYVGRLRDDRLEIFAAVSGDEAAANSGKYILLTRINCTDERSSIEVIAGESAGFTYRLAGTAVMFPVVVAAALFSGGG